MKLIVAVKEIEGVCPVYKAGDSFVVSFPPGKYRL